MRYTMLAIALFISGCSERSVEDAVSARMRDPDAVKFRQVERCPRDRNLWSGELNAKNGFGAYNGFEPFFYSNDELVMADHPRFEGTAGRCFGLEGLEQARAYSGNYRITREGDDPP